MIFHPARKGVAPPLEKTAPASPADVFIAGNERAIMQMAIMQFPKEAMTEVYRTSSGFLAISQPEEECPNCSEKNTAIVTFTASRARLVAAELSRLADALEEEDVFVGVSSNHDC